MLPPGLRIGDHVVLRHAASGAMSEVYEGRHVSSGARVAVKVLPLEWCEDEEVSTRFLNEARMLQHLRHARIVSVFESGTLPEGQPFMILEWLPTDLHRALLRSGGRLPIRAAARVTQQLAEALAVLHEQGLVHRDLKPSNVLLSREDAAGLDVKLADLGLAKVLAPGAAPLSTLPISTGGSARLGTWDYMAPEQWVRAKDAEPKSDVYALGVLWFQLLAGRLPFVAEQQKDLMYFHLLEQPPLELLDSRVPTATRELLTRMLEKKPALRPTMRELLELPGLAA
jgi:serine/threonine-protein kinase